MHIEFYHQTFHLSAHVQTHPFYTNHSFLIQGTKGPIWSLYIPTNTLYISYRHRYRPMDESREVKRGKFLSHFSIFEALVSTVQSMLIEARRVYVHAERLPISPVFSYVHSRVVLSTTCHLVLLLLVHSYHVQ